ncbi:expressed unknown protein [Seminavis robusta]|uniref:Uncharacterized protein n=1 Tax=Seminavis robusta TaxID=568900 RepID=A0A9N8DHX1_9STRA|nr:expressed unknown protein [Seminavis robusta]|eukprot:Sro130_g061900.1 n/a (459) ;mRNA; f:48660-50036
MLRSGHRISTEKLWSLVGHGGGVGRRPSSCVGRAFTVVKESATTPLTPLTTATPKGGNVLGSAAEEAQRLSELAAQCRRVEAKKPETIMKQKPVITTTTTTTTPSPLSLEDEKALESALDGAQKLLSVTTKSSPLLDAIQNKPTANPDIQRQIACLHRAFIVVTSWCLDVVDRTCDKTALDKALQVARRAHQLQLPLHVPLHQRLVVAIAQHYDPIATSVPKHRVRSPAGLILEIAERAAVSFDRTAVATSPFFRDALVALAQRHHYHDILTLMRGMESQFRIVELELETLAQLLAVLQDQCDNDNNDIAVTDQKDFYEILSRLNPYVWKTMSQYSPLTERLTTTTKQQPQQSVLPTTPTPKPKDDWYYFRNWIYQTDSPRQVLPDITAQMDDLYAHNELRYSEALERSILKSLMADFEDSYYDDEELEMLSEEEDEGEDTDYFHSDDDEDDDDDTKT